jgi:hypothetical protein
MAKRRVRTKSRVAGPAVRIRVGFWSGKGGEWVGGWGAMKCRGASGKAKRAAGCVRLQLIKWGRGTRGVRQCR